MSAAQLDGQRAYWDARAESSAFELPVEVEALAGLVGRDAALLDLGCGYGRVLGALRDAGFTRLTGLDPSPRMLARARALVPEAEVAVLGGLPSPFEAGSFDAILLVAVLTCTPRDDDQRALVAEAARLLRPGGVFHVVDFLLADDARNRERYDRGVAGHPHGVFALADGAVHRHHDRAWLGELLSGFEPFQEATFDARTRHGNPARGFTWLGRRP